MICDTYLYIYICICADIDISYRLIFTYMYIRVRICMLSMISHRIYLYACMYTQLYQIYSVSCFCRKVCCFEPDLNMFESVHLQNDANPSASQYVEGYSTMYQLRVFLHALFFTVFHVLNCNKKKRNMKRNSCS